MTNKIIQLNDGSIETQHAPIYPELKGTSPSRILALIVEMFIHQKFGFQ